MGTTASLTLGVSVGAAFALMIVVLIAAYCIYTYKHPEKRPGHAGKVKPDNLAKMRENTDKSTAKKTEDSFCFCCVKSANDIVPPPDPPIKLELKDLQSNDVTISWKPPIAYAASRIKNYVIYVRPSDKPNDWTRLAKLKNDVIQHLVQPLESDKRYVLGVASKNSGGESAIIETKPFILPRQITVPGKPKSVVVTDIQSNQVTLQCDAPQNDGNAKIEFYDIWAKNGDGEWNHVTTGAATGTGNKFTIQHLLKNVPYKFRICAENSVGKGPYAETKRHVILKNGHEPPAKPIGPIKYNKITHSSVTLSWTIPNDDGGLPITGYAISVLDTGNGEWRDVGVSAENVTTFCVPKLPEDTEFRVKVSAVNEAGSSTPLIGGKVRTKLKETSSYGSQSQSPRSGQSVSASSNTKLTRSALQRVLAHWEPSSHQVPPTSTNSAFVRGNITPKSNRTEKTRALDKQMKLSSSGLRTEPRLETRDQAGKPR